MTTWQRLIAYVGESDQWQGKPAYMALVEEAKKHGIAGATVIRGIEGFGVRESGRIHTATILELSSELPMLVVIIRLLAEVRQQATGNRQQWEELEFFGIKLI
jgi:PII-like signaling protein